jgi:homoserine kinase
MSTNNETTKLAATALLSASLGALLSYYLHRRSHDPSASSSTAHPPPTRTSFIFHDPAEVSSTSGTDAAVLFPHSHEERMRRRIAARMTIEEENSQPRQCVTVRVPASSANCGPGFDCIGLAVDLWTEVTVRRADRFEITAEGDGAEDMPKDESNYIVTGVKAAYETAQKEMPPLHYHIVSRIPYARGLGSSSAAIVAGIIAGLVLAGHRLPVWGSESLLQIAASIEGHPDNVAPVIYGGFQIGIHNGTRWLTERVPTPPGLQLVMFIPDFIGKTSAARGLLKDTIHRQDAAFNIGRVAFLVHALAVGNLDNLKWGVQDKMHQPQRAAAIYPHLYPMIKAAEEAGACCAYLSGAGPTVMAMTSGASGDIFTQREKERTDFTVARAMMEVAQEFGVKGRIVVTQASQDGARVVKVDPPFSTADITFRDNV